MGLTLQFFIGDKNRITNAVHNENFEILEDLENRGMSCDFSLHITAKDLDLFFIVLSRHLNKTPISLRDNLDGVNCFCDHPDRGAFYVNEIVKKLVEKCQQSDVSKIAMNWYQILSKEFPEEEIGDSSDAEGSIRDLIRICSIGVSQNRDLVHVWFQ